MKLRFCIATALMAAVLCVAAPLAVPLGPVPITCATLVVYLAAGLLGPWRSAAAVGLYLALGAVGLPVFAGFGGGFQHLFGPTGGFLWGYLLCALIVGTVCQTENPARVPLWLVCGAAVLYAAGCGWYAWQTHTSCGVAAVTCLLPNLPGEIVKIAVASSLILSLRGRVGRLLTAGIKE